MHHQADQNANRQQALSLLPRNLTEDLETHALAFLFTGNVVWSARDLRASHGHLDFLESLYLKSPSASPLAVATTWLAVLLMGTYDKGRPYPLEQQLLTKVYRSAVAAVHDPIESLRDETLTVVILLSFGEHLCDQRYGRKSSASIIHQQGAEALIRKRGLLNFRDRMTLSLFDAIRHNAVNQVISGGRNPTNWDLWELDGDIGQRCDSYTPATEIDACAVTLVTLKHRVTSGNVSKDSTLRKDIMGLLERLRSWPSCIPADWMPRKGPCGTHESHDLPEVTYLFYQWYLLQVTTSHLAKEMDIRINFAIEPVPLDFLCELQWIGQLVACEDVFLGDWSKKSDPLGSAKPELYVGGTSSVPRATVELCLQSPYGSRLLRQTLVKLDNVLSKALEELLMPTDVALRYSEVVSWARREKDTISRAFPLVTG